jgi:CRP-like cAMP-binding protein
MKTLEPMLAEHPFLQGLDEAHLKLITGCASNVKFDQDQFLFREGEEANQFFILREGKVLIEIHSLEQGPISIQTVTAGDILGWSWLVPPYRWRFDARALEPTRAFALDGKCLRNKCEEDHHLGYELLKRFSHVMADRLEATRLQLLDVYGTKT